MHGDRGGRAEARPRKLPRPINTKAVGYKYFLSDAVIGFYVITTTGIIRNCR